MVCELDINKTFVKRKLSHHIELRWQGHSQQREE